MPPNAWKRRAERMLAMGLLAALMGLVACDPQRIKELEEGVSTEADVKARFGEPEQVWDAPKNAAPGTKVFEYNRQPEGTTNYMIAIGPDGKMSALRQVLSAQNFEKILPGMLAEDVRKALGKPAKVATFALSKEIHWEWHFADGPGSMDRKIFSVAFNPDMKVLTTATAPDPRAQGESPGR